MNYWDVKYTIEATKDRDALDSSTRNQVDKVIRKVSQNPLPRNEGGYGNPLGNKRGRNLTGLCKIKLLKSGIRVVYRIVRDEEIMRVIVIAVRADDEVYEMAIKRGEQD